MNHTKKKMLPQLRSVYFFFFFFACRKKCDKEKREKLMNELQKLLQGKIKSVRKNNAIMQKFTKALKNGEI